MTVLAIIVSFLVFVISLITLCIIHALPTDGKLLYFDGFNYRGTYLVEVKLGMPLQRAFFGLSTTGGPSQVAGYPCDTCEKLKVSLYNPNNSTTYINVTCLSNSCRSIKHLPCGSAENRFCKYEEVSLGRYITTSGNLASETVQFKNTTGTVSLPGIILGCIHGIKIRPGIMRKNDLGSGYVDLSNHKLSLINQVYKATDGVVPRMFSYCIPLEENKSSRTYIGPTPPSKKVSHTTTPLYISHGKLYYLHLVRLEINFKNTTPVHIAMKQEKGPQSSTKGNILVDTMSPITFLEKSEMHEVERNVLKGVRLKPVAAPKGLDPVIKICFDWSERNASVLPEFYFIFENEAQIRAGAILSEIKPGVICLLIASDEFATGSAQVLGSAAQIDHRLEFDLDKKEVKIAPDDCESRE